MFRRLLQRVSQWFDDHQPPSMCNKPECTKEHLCKDCFGYWATP
jgi:hypothetical protein